MTARTWTDATIEEHEAFMAMNPEFSDRPQQAGLEVEARLLALGFTTLAALDPILGQVVPGSFAHGLHRQVWRVLAQARQDGEREIDVLAVHQRLGGSPELLPALVAIEQQSPGVPATPDRVQSLASAVLALAKRREQDATLNAVAALAFDRDRPAQQRLEEARKLLEQAERAAGDAHPLAQFVEHATETPAVRWLIPGLIEHGVVTISGARGVGKTTSVLPLAMTAAGLHHPDYPLAPKHWRHVVYIVEHVDQAHRIIAGIVKHGGLGITMEDVRERVHLVEAKRLPPAQVAQVGKLYRERFIREVRGVELRPLVVFDTKAAVLALDNENDNSEGSRAVAAIRQDFEGLPAWIVGHIAKSQFGRTDVAALSDRGAGSFEADTIQNCYLVKEGEGVHEQRLFLVGKERCNPKWRELKVESGMAETMGVDEFGDLEPTTLSWGILKPLDVSRSEARQEAQKAAERERRGDMREAVLDAVQIAWQAGNPLSKNGVRGKVSGKAAEVLREVESLMADGWLHEVEVQSKQRVNNAKARFLVRLDTPEHDDFMQSGVLPDAKLVVPASWKKSSIPLVPEADA
ncbi:MAG: hypothetical protein RLZZ22_505 [Pseudomonadota bacterium]|jgi:hypothetical protein